MTRTILWRRLGLVVVIGLTVVAVGSRVLGLLSLALGGSVRAAPFTLRSGSDEVKEVQPSAMAEGLRVGDRLTTVEGQPFSGLATLGRALRRTPEGGRLVVEVQREAGETVDSFLFALTTVTRRLDSRTERVAAAALGVLLPTFCAVLGLYVLIRRSDDVRAWLLFALLVSIGSTGEFSALDPHQLPVALRLPTVAFRPFFFTWPLWMALFGVYFPDRSMLDRRSPWAKWLLVLPVATLAVTVSVWELARSEAWRFAQLASRILDFLGPSWFYLALIGNSAFFGLLFHKSATLDSPDSRRRLRLLWTGAVLSLTPVLALVIFTKATGREQSSLPIWFVVACLAMLLFPLTLAYVIVVQKALDVGVVIRQGLQYAFARNTVLIVQTLLSAGFVLGVVLLAADPSAERWRRIAFMAAGLAAVFWLQAAARRIRTFIDRRFFREAVDTEQMLTGVGEEARQVVEPSQLLETVSRRLAEALHVPHVAAFVEDAGGYRLVQAHGLASVPPVYFDRTSDVVDRLRERGMPLAADPEDRHSWAADSSAAAELRSLRTQLLIPLQVKDRLPGFLSLGPKRSEQAFSPSDLRVLSSVGAQVGLALENARLAAEVATETARRERMNRELEIAREVQERLFPQNLPPVDGLDYAGRCRPARGVGGDYYDFLPLVDGRLGLAIGDVSGKGVSAALLMASLQASLRGQTAFGPPALAEIMSRVNRLICETSGANRYATFFYASYDPASQRLDYVNAGHNAPMLLRSDRTVERLDRGGPVVGLFEESAYESASIELRAGDLLVAYTDGLSEAMNPQGDEWGEERMIEAAWQLSDQPAREIVDALMSAAKAFAAGAPQHDDVTVVAARLTR